MTLVDSTDCAAARRIAFSPPLQVAHAIQAFFAILTLISIVVGTLRHRRLLASSEGRANCAAAASRPRSSLKLLLRAGLTSGAILAIATLVLRSREFIVASIYADSCLVVPAWQCIAVLAPTSFGVISCYLSFSFILIERFISAYCLSYYNSRSRTLGYGLLIVMVSVWLQLIASTKFVIV